MHHPKTQELEQWLALTYMYMDSVQSSNGYRHTHVCSKTGGVKVIRSEGGRQTGGVFTKMQVTFNLNIASNERYIHVHTCIYSRYGSCIRSEWDEILQIQDIFQMLR